MNRKDYLLGINNYCKSQHTINEAKKSLLVKSYKKLSCNLLYEDYCLSRISQNFYYQKWLTKE